jgi:hypothetical protein
MKIIVAGTIGRSGLGGQAWAVLQYLLGFRALGHDVYYVEDCGVSSWVYNWDKNEWTTALDYPAAYVRDCLEPFGFAGKWIYRTNDGAIGMEVKTFQEVCFAADLLVLRAVPMWVRREEYNGPKRRAFLDVDPGFTQISIAQGDKGVAEGVARCERRFTVGQRIGASDCPVPTEAGPWIPTLPPVFMGEWPRAMTGTEEFTSIIRWQGFREAQHNGAAYGQRDKEFPKFFDLPKLTGQKFRVAMLGTKPETLTERGWAVAPGEVISKTPGSYRDFIHQSRGEFCVPKHGYVETRGGWVSDRSVCYLASGRPVLMEETAISECIPCGEGLVTFTDLRTAADALARVNANYDQHSEAARSLAENVFSTEKVLPQFLDAAMG